MSGGDLLRHVDGGAAAGGSGSGSGSGWRRGEEDVHKKKRRKIEQDFYDDDDLNDDEYVQSEENKAGPIKRSRPQPASASNHRRRRDITDADTGESGDAISGGTNDTAEDFHDDEALRHIGGDSSGSDGGGGRVGQATSPRTRRKKKRKPTAMVLSPGDAEGGTVKQEAVDYGSGRGGTSGEAGDAAEETKASKVRSCRAGVFIVIGRCRHCASFNTLFFLRLV